MYRQSQGIYTAFSVIRDNLIVLLLNISYLVRLSGGRYDPKIFGDGSSDQLWWQL